MSASLSHSNDIRVKKKSGGHHFETLGQTILASLKTSQLGRLGQKKNDFLAVAHKRSANARLREFVVVKNIGEQNVKAFKKRKKKKKSFIFSCLNWTDADIDCELIAVSARQ